MNVIERMKSIDAERKISDFRVKQQLPYDFKIAYAEVRAREFFEECARRDLNCHVSGALFCQALPCNRFSELRKIIKRR